MIPTAAIGLYFAATGRGADYVQWTFVFPLLEYPANTDFVAKLYTKLLFFVVLFAASLAASLLPAVRSALWRSNAMRVAWLFGTLNLFALLKTQASHYFYPAAAFMCISTACVLSSFLERTSEHRRWELLVAATTSLGLLAASVALYRPDAVARLLQLRRFERKMRSAHISSATSNPTVG